MSRSSTYTLDLVVRDDQARTAMGDIRQQLGAVREAARGAIDPTTMASMREAVEQGVSRFSELAAHAGDGFSALRKNFSREADRAIAALQRQYAALQPAYSEYERLLAEQTQAREAEQAAAQKAQAYTEKTGRAMAEYIQRTVRISEMQERLAGLVQAEGEGTFDVLLARRALARETERATATADRAARLWAKSAPLVADRREKTAELERIQAAMTALGGDELAQQVRLNREMRARLEQGRRITVFGAATARREAAQEKLRELREKRRHASDKRIQKDLDVQIRQLKGEAAEYQRIEKAQKAVAAATETQSKAMRRSWSERTWKAGKAVAGVGATAVSAGASLTRSAIRGGGALLGVVGALGGIADRAVERERLAGRIKNLGGDEASRVLDELYYRTGADYTSIADAINRASGTLTTAGDGDLLAAAEAEIRYPGASVAFASTHTEASGENYRRYLARLQRIQHATGASGEQVAASTERLANLDGRYLSGATVTELQSVYLALQGSGAFDTPDELEAAFGRFVRDRAAAGSGVFEVAQSYDWGKTLSGVRNRLQAAHTVGRIGWRDIGAALGTFDQTAPVGTTEAERVAEQARRLAAQKDQLLLQLMPALADIMDELARLDWKTVVRAISRLLTTVIPGLLELLKLMRPVLEGLTVTIRWLGQKFGYMDMDDESWGVVSSSYREAVRQLRDGVRESAARQAAAGGIVVGPSIVGERGPEMVLPLDYSRAQRATNVTTSITQNFSFGGGGPSPTALSLSSAVRSRDFTRAMTENEFFTRRCGGF